MKDVKILVVPKALVGGIIAEATDNVQLSITNCVNESDLKQTNFIYYGGIAGYIRCKQLIMKGCVNKSDIYTKSCICIGGLIGVAGNIGENDFIINGCTNCGNMISEDTTEGAMGRNSIKL